ncbi:MAG: hypothetical protein AAF081_06970 [Actinomycetota bacterium]
MWVFRLKSGAGGAEPFFMRFERLVIEADENTFSLDFHPRLTVISGVGRLEREGLISELVGSLSSSRAGVHAEVVADNGNRFAIFRPFGARARVIDVEASADVSARFADGEGRIDLLHVAGMDMRSAKRALRVTASDLTTSTHHEQIVRRLAMTDPALLWAAAERVKAAQVELDQAAADSGSAPEDAAVVARIEDRHQRFEEAQARAETFRKISFVAGAISALAAVPSAMYVNQLVAMAWIIVAAVVTALSFVQHQRMERARTAETEALAAAGAESYLGFHLQRVNGLLDSEQARKKLMDASAEYDEAMAAWTSIAGDIVPEWAYEYQDEIETASAQLANMNSFGSGQMAESDDDVHALAHALMQRITKVRTVGPAGESLPLVLDDALQGLDADMKATLLELLVHSSDQQQIVFLTEDALVTEWARVEAITGDLSILEPSGAGEPAVDVTDDAVNVA